MADEATIEAKARAALASAVDPFYGKSLGDLGSLLEVSVAAQAVQVGVRLSSAQPQLKERVLESMRQALVEAQLGHLTLEADWEVAVPTRQVRGDDPIAGVRNVLLVMSGKGGVGKSTVAVNLALGLKRLGHRVGLLDADVYGPSIPTMLGVLGRPGSKDGKRIEPLGRFGIKLMSIGFLLDKPTDAVIWRGPMLHGALQQFIADVDWGELDFLVLDLPPGTGDVALSLAQRLQVTGAVMVTTPQEVALQDVYKGVSMCRKLQIPILGVVENMSFFVDPSGLRHTVFGEGGGKKVAAFAEAPLLAQLPLDAVVRAGGDEGMPIVQGAPHTDAGKAMMGLAERVVEVVAQHHFERQGDGKAPKAQAPKRLAIVR